MNLEIENLLEQSVAVCGRAVFPGGLTLAPRAKVSLSVDTGQSPRFVPALDRMVAAGWIKYTEAGKSAVVAPPAPVPTPAPVAVAVPEPVVEAVAAEVSPVTDDGKQGDSFKKNKKKD